jgi:hypothetical protein
VGRSDAIQSGPPDDRTGNSQDEQDAQAVRRREQPEHQMQAIGAVFDQAATHECASTQAQERCRSTDEAAEAWIGGR